MSLINKREERTKLIQYALTEFGGNVLINMQLTDNPDEIKEWMCVLNTLASLVRTGEVKLKVRGASLLANFYSRENEINGQIIISGTGKSHLVGIWKDRARTHKLIGFSPRTSKHYLSK